MAVAGATSCSPSSFGESCLAGECRGERTVSWQFQNSVPYDFDILFVVDDGVASTALSATMASVYPQMAQLLQSLTPPGVTLAADTRAPPSLHVAFVPSSYAGGDACSPSALRANACGLTAPDQFLSSAACGLRPNFAGSWEDAFSCMATFGPSACDPSQPLAAMRRALGGDLRRGALEGSAFSRDGAALQVVIVAAQDDASGSPGALEDVATFAGFLKTLRSDPNQIMVSVLGPSSGCTDSPPTGSLAPRLTALVEAFGSHGLYVPSCSHSPLAALEELGAQLGFLIAPPCLAGIRDSDVDMAGVQPTCVVGESTEQIDGSIKQATLSSCDRAAPPCWRLTSNPVLCPGTLLLDIDRGAGWCPELSTTTQISCIGCLDAGIRPARRRVKTATRRWRTTIARPASPRSQNARIRGGLGGRLPPTMLKSFLIQVRQGHRSSCVTACLGVLRRRLAILPAALLLAGVGACSGHGQTSSDGGGGSGGGGGSVVASPVVISVASPRPRTGSWSVNYWTWPATYGNSVAGTETMVAALAPTYMRVGGYNNDANLPDPFDNAHVDAMITYARAIGAQPILQVPLLADTAGQPATPASAAAMVTYANVTKAYGIKYFSIGNEPDLYATSGLPSNAALPARPGYTAAGFCADATAFVAAMKSADPTIQIVGPDLSYQYQPFADWLTPILTTCGDLFDIVAVHRYPFSSEMATLPNAIADAPTFRALVASLRRILQTTGHADKPLAITEMNVVYNATTTVIGASPGTVASGLWMADIVGSALDLGLWTVAEWDISDPDQYSLGLIGLPPSHTPRPEYYAYALYAGHSGPMLVDVTSTPANVRAYATRNAAGTATEVIAINWNSASAPLAFEITGLPKAPPTAIFQLPPLSMAAVEIPDNGATPASASVYGGDQRAAGAGLQALAPGTGTITGGVGGSAGDAGVDAAPICASLPPPSVTITTQGVATGTTLTFGPASYLWGSYVYASTGQPTPVATVTADGNGIEIVDSFTSATVGGYAGVGLYFSGTTCLDASKYKGIKFDLAGDLGGCALALGSASSGDLDSVVNPGRGGCSSVPGPCYGPSAAVTAGAATVMVPFTALTGGMPVGTLDPTTIATVQWQLAPPASGACAADFTVSNVAFY